MIYCLHTSEDFLLPFPLNCILFLFLHNIPEPGIMQMETDLETVDSRSGDSVEESHPDVPSPPPCGDTSGAFCAPASIDPSTTCQSAMDTCSNLPCLGDSQQTSVPCADSSGQTSGLQHRIKPDSSWIKTDPSEENEETNGSVLLKPISAEEGSIPESEDTSDCVQSASDNITNSSKSFIAVESEIEFHSESNSQTFQPQQHCDDKSNEVDVFQKTLTLPSHSSPSEDESMATDEYEITSHSISTAPRSLENLAALSAYDQNQNPMAHPQASESTISLDKSHSFSENSEEASSLMASPKKNVEVGVKEYFYREKIPWNPGKVQKIREGINRTGQMLSSTSDEGLGIEKSCTSDNSEEAMQVEGHDMQIAKGDNKHPHIESELKVVAS